MQKNTPKSQGHRNNFNVVRFLAAIFVVIGHTGPIIGRPAVTLFGIELHAIGVQILFFMGGYLVTSSWKRDRRVPSFFYKRFMRLWPSYAVMILIMTFLTGPLLSDLGIRGYFAAGWTEYLKNLRFYIIFAQPGVFSNVQMPYVTNGSLWTMPVEAVLYILTPIVYELMGRGKRRRSLWILGIHVAVLCGLNIAFYSSFEKQVIFYATDWIKAGKLMVFYLLGMLCSFDEVQRFFRLQWACLILLLLGPMSSLSTIVKGIIMQIGIPYFVLSFALAEKPLFSGFGKKYELSYGIYLYGFFFQQLTVSCLQKVGIQADYLLVTLISLVLTLIAAWLNCVLIEKPLTKLKKS